MTRLQTVLGIAARLLVGGAFVFAGVSKLLSIDPFVSALDWVSTLLSLPPAYLDVARVVVPRAEIVLGLCLLAGLYLKPALYVGGAVLVALLGLLIAGSFERHGIASCGCFGQKVLDTGGPVVWIVRNGGLALLAFFAASCGRTVLALDSVLARKKGRSGLLAPGERGP